MTSPIEIVREFIDAINRHDVAMITSLMTKSHRFVDAKGVELTGRERLHDAWQGYFSLFPVVCHLSAEPQMLASQRDQCVAIRPT